MEGPLEIGKFRVIRTLGQGAMGRVYLAEDPLIDRRVAIKVMSVEGDAEARERFRNEARAIGQLSHPNIVQLYEFGFHQDQPYLVMEYLEGESLDQWLEREPPLGSRIAVLLDLCRAVEHAHGRGVLHRDVKPSNVQVRPDGTCKLVDFGIARSRSVQLTATGVVLGTPEFIAPEILREAGYSSRSDLYAVALVIYQVLTGTNPFRAGTLEGCLTRVMTHQPEPLAAVRPELGEELSEILEACLRKEPAQRPDDLKPVMAALERIIDPDLERTVALSEASREVPYPTMASTMASAVASTMASTLPPRPPASARPWWRSGLALVSAAALGAAVLATLAWRTATETAPDLRPPTLEPKQADGSPPAMETASEPASTTPAAAELPSRRTEPISEAPESTDRRQNKLPKAVDAGKSRTNGPPVAKPAPAQPPPDKEPASRPGETPESAGEPEPETRPGTPTTPLLPPPPARTEPPVAAPPSDPAPLDVDAGEDGEASDSGLSELRPEVLRPEIRRLAPDLVRRGSGATLRLEGSGFGPEARVEVRRGRQAVGGIRIRKLKADGEGIFRISLFVDQTVPLGLYTVVVIDAEGNESDPVTLEVGL